MICASYHWNHYCHFCIFLLIFTKKKKRAKCENKNHTNTYVGEKKTQMMPKLTCSQANSITANVHLPAMNTVPNSTPKQPSISQHIRLKEQIVPRSNDPPKCILFQCPMLNGSIKTPTGVRKLWKVVQEFVVICGAMSVGCDDCRAVSRLLPVC